MAKHIYTTKSDLKYGPFRYIIDKDVDFTAPMCNFKLWGGNKIANATVCIRIKIPANMTVTKYPTNEFSTVSSKLRLCDIGHNIMVKVNGIWKNMDALAPIQPRDLHIKMLMDGYRAVPEFGFVTRKQTEVRLEKLAAEGRKLHISDFSIGDKVYCIDDNTNIRKGVIIKIQKNDITIAIPENKTFRYVTRSVSNVFVTHESANARKNETSITVTQVMTNEGDITPENLIKLMVQKGMIGKGSASEHEFAIIRKSIEAIAHAYVKETEFNANTELKVGDVIYYATRKQKIGSAKIIDITNKIVTAEYKFGDNTKLSRITRPITEVFLTKEDCYKAIRAA